MKITAGQLRQIIKEELGSLNEQSIPQDMIERLNSAMMSIAEFVMDKYDDDSAEGVAETEAILTDELNGFMESLEDMDMSRASDNDMDTDNDGMISADELSDEIEDIKDDLEMESFEVLLTKPRGNRVEKRRVHVDVNVAGHKTPRESKEAAKKVAAEKYPGYSASFAEFDKVGGLDANY